MSMEELSEEPEVNRPSQSAHGSARIGIALLIFALGLLCGIPVAMFGVDIIVDNAFVIFAVMFGLLLISAVLTAVIIAFRRPILQTVVRRSEVEMERFARPLAAVARFAAEQKVNEATEAAREVGELMLARYAWISTRRWMVATITAFVASIAALAGSALLFQQNQLLREQTGRIVEQNALLSQQIELGEAQRSTSIVPEILEIGAAVGTETNALAEDGREARFFLADELSPALRARIIAATVAARPYRYLETAMARASDSELNALALDRRTDLPDVLNATAAWRASEAAIAARSLQEADRLIDRPTSPERGQLLSILFNSRVMSTEELSWFGADFSFAEVRLQTFGAMSLRHALLRFADFSGVQIRQGEFGAAYLEQARFHRAVVADSNFGGIPHAEIEPPYIGDESLPVWRTQMAGADFGGALIVQSDFSSTNGVGMRFDFALLHEVDFTDAALGGSTFRDAILGDLVLSGADLKSIDLTGAFVFKPDFLNQMAAAAFPETFVVDRYRLVPVEISVLESQPVAIQLWHIPGYGEDGFQVWRIERAD